ncbi:MAG: PQQ-dependent sugar dehydrogenase [Myxococcales bacterium]|nr:PQQ-dependent sugar dehydrogenase [Myxococcales bacterium]
MRASAHRRAGLRVAGPLLAAVVASGTAGACGDTAPGGGDGGAAEGGAVTDATVTPPGSDAADAADATVADAKPDTSDGAVGPTRAPFGLDARPANPTCRLPTRPAAPTRSLRLTRVFASAGLVEPLAMAQIPGDRTRFFFLERGGRLVSVAGPGATSKTVVATFPDTDTEGEGGALGLAFHPRFAQNGFAYVSYTRAGVLGMESLIVRLRSTDNGVTFGPPTIVLGPFEQPASNHNGGDLHFGPDGLLYASFGDGGGQNDPLGNGQRKDTFFSKLLRIDVDTPSPPNAYSIPDGNPWKAGGGEPATFAYGFRNPYRFSIDSVTGDVWVGDVGEDTWEELNKVVAGGNYGWSRREGPECFPPGATCSTAGLEDPIVSLPHADAFAVAIVGGPVYRGAKMPGRVGQVLFADVLSKLFSLRTDPATGVASWTQEVPDFPLEPVVAIVEDDAKEVYLLAYTNEVYAIDEEPGPPATTTFPEKLSDTGCFQKSNPKLPVSAMIPYSPNSPFWSDGAEKERYFAIPDGAKITVTASGDFDFPIGTVLAKSFRIAGKLVETRLFARHDDGEWGGYSYEWNDTETDATLLPAGKVKTVGTTAWTYPSRGDCFRCHTAAAGRSLGLELGQLNGDGVYPSTNRISNQLRTLDRAGFLTAPLPDPATLVAYPPPFEASAGSLEARARSYLHSNCSNCHRPGGTARGNFDFLYASTLAGSRMCGATPVAGDLGVAGAKVLDPSKPATSLLSLRMRAPAACRMPPLATRQVDAQGALLVDDWIRSLATCPP